MADTADARGKQARAPLRTAGTTLHTTTGCTAAARAAPAKMAQINRVTFGFYAPDELRGASARSPAADVRPNERADDERSLRSRLGPTGRPDLPDVQSNRKTLRRPSGCD